MQPQPFDKSQVQYEPGAGLGPSTYYAANGVIETDCSLGVFSGTIASDGAPTDFTAAGKPGLQNVVFPPFQGSKVIRNANMGGCTGCQAGAAAATGTDFSFIVGETAAVPEIPSSGISAVLRQHHQRLLIDPVGVSRQRQ